MRVLIAIALASLCAARSFAAAEHFSVVAANEIVGNLDATVDGRNVGIEYKVRNNGRGPTLSEHITLGADLIPIRWTVDGTTAFGGRVAEQFGIDNGRVKWRSQADTGDDALGARKLYIANDASPWSFGLYANALLRARGRSLDVLPSGTLKLAKIRDLKFDGTSVSAYLLFGVNLIPDAVLLDRDQRLFAIPESSSVLIRTGFEKHVDRILALGKELEVERLKAIQRETVHRFDQPLRIGNVHLFDPVAQKLTPPKFVTAYRGRISSVGEYKAESVRGEFFIDGHGGTLVPGLHDMHSHNYNWQGLFYLAAGVTNVRDMGNVNADLLALTASIDAGEMPGPRIVRSGFLEGRSPYSARLGFIPETLPEALDDVRWYADHGYRQMKIYNSMNPDWVAPIAGLAHSLGMRVSGHVPAFMSPDRAIRDGYDEINHLNQLSLGWVIGPKDDTRTPLRLTALGERTKTLSLTDPRMRATIDLMKEHRTALDPTIVIIERLMMSRAGKVNEGDAPYLDHVPIGYQRYRKRSFVDFKTPELDRDYVESFERLLQILKLLHDEGIRLLPGTDDGTGFTVHRELELYVKAGMSPGEVLSMATLGCARYLGQEQELGSIEPGKRADFFLIAGNPLDNIRAIRSAEFVLKDDELYLPAELYDAVGIVPFAAKPTIVAPR